MDHIQTGNFILAGLKLPHKTINEGGESSRDCGRLWEKFRAENVLKRITDRLNDDVYAVYFAYEGDHTQPFSYFIGCQVAPDAETPIGMDTLRIPGGTYSRITAQGRMPDCIADAWEEIWGSSLARAYKFDFEVYGDRSKDWNNAAVDIYVSSIP